MDTIGTPEHGPELGRQFDEEMEIASRLAGREDVRAIHIVLAERPTYDALLRYRQLAEARGLTLTLTADLIVLRPQQLSDEAGAAPAQPTGRWDKNLVTVASGTWKWLRDHAWYRVGVGRATEHRQVRGGDHANPRTP